MLADLAILFLTIQPQKTQKEKNGIFSPSYHSSKQQTKAKHWTAELETACESKNGELLRNYIASTIATTIFNWVWW